MSHTSISQNFLGLARGFRKLNAADPLAQCLAPRLSRSLATAVEIPVEEIAQQISSETNITRSAPTRTIERPRVLTTLYSWPRLEPKRFAWYGSQYLDMPLRKDILHRAVIYEADATRQGTASAKWRGDVHGSNRKIAPQKGLGRARVGDKKSPIRRGGGVAHGPVPRDFSTELPRKVYDIAFRTALSYRYRKGELLILDEKPSMPEDSTTWLLHNVFTTNNWGKGHGRTLLVTDLYQPEEQLMRTFEHMRDIGEHGEIKDLDDVDVKDLLSAGRVIIDTSSLNTLLAAHTADLGTQMSLDHARSMLEVEPKLLDAFVRYSEKY